MWWKSNLLSKNMVFNKNQYRSDTFVKAFEVKHLPKIIHPLYIYQPSAFLWYGTDIIKSLEIPLSIVKRKETYSEFEKSMSLFRFAHLLLIIYMSSYEKQLYCCIDFSWARADFWYFHTTRRCLIVKLNIKPAYSQHWIMVGWWWCWFTR